MLLAVVDELDPRRRKRRIEATKHFSRDRSGSLGVHRPYIEEFNGDEAIQDAWTGRGSAGAMRGARLRRARRVQGAAAIGQFRRAWRLALPMSRPCPRAQREVQFLRRDEP